MHNCTKCRQLHSALNCNRFVNTGFTSQTAVQTKIKRIQTMLVGNKLDNVFKF